VTGLAALRAEFPVLERLSYLNAGTNGPVPRMAIEAVQGSLRTQSEGGRGDMAFFMGVIERAEALRARVAALAGCEPGELALTTSTTDGVNSVVSALELGAGDEVLTSDEEHPGVLAPLAVGRERRGFEVRVVPFEELASAVGPRTKLVACSHVSWVTGRVVDAAALAATDAPVLLDGAQGLGAVPLDLHRLGCDFYAASGQKWLCGPNGAGYLYVRAERISELLPAWPSYGSLVAPERALDLELQPQARRFDVGFPVGHQVEWALASLDALETPGKGAAQEAGPALAARLADALAERGRTVAPRGRSTLVSWEVADPEAEVERLRGADVVLRNIPTRPYVRASVGAWTGEDELRSLVALAA
jgi:selenocysteine lyase/cysteine desulfurase